MESCAQTDKFKIAVQNNIPVVPLSWVEACVRAQKILDVQSTSREPDSLDDKPANSPLFSDSPEKLRAAQAPLLTLRSLRLGEQGDLPELVCNLAYQCATSMLPSVPLAYAIITIYT